ncbi:MAG: AI-2E family transporter [Candidatus Paceibacterota bacterium]
MLSWPSTKNKTQVVISPSIVVFTVSFLGFIYFLFVIRSLLMLLFLAFILVVALNPAVNRFQKHLRFPRGLSIAVTYVLFFLLIAAAAGLILPPLTTEVIRLIKTIDWPYLQDWLGNVFQISNFEIGSLVSQFSNSINFLVGAITSASTGIFTFITLLIMSFYLMLDRPKLYKKIAWFTGEPKHLQRAEEFVDNLEIQLGGWVRGEIILMTSIALMTYFGLSLLKIPFALPLAIIAGLLEILPNLGPFLSAVPSVVFAYVTFGPTMAIAVVGLYIIIQQLENSLLVPKIMKKNAHVNPLVSIMSILIGLKIGGIAGGLLAIPLYITLRATFSTWRKYSA